MEAFFTMEGVLVVAVCTKKDYMAVALPEYPLADSCWVSVDTDREEPFCLLWLVPNQKKGENQTQFPVTFKDIHASYDV